MKLKQKAVSLWVTFVFNLLYALYHGLLGVLNRSLWFIACCHKSPSVDTEQLVMRFSGVLLGILGLVLTAVYAYFIWFYGISRFA